MSEKALVIEVCFDEDNACPWHYWYDGPHCLWGERNPTGWCDPSVCPLKSHPALIRLAEEQHG